MNENNTKSIWKEKIIKNPQAWIAVVFLVYIFVLPIMTLYGMNTTEAVAVDADAILEANGTTAGKTTDSESATLVEEETSQETVEQKLTFSKIQEMLNGFTEKLFMRNAFISLNSDLTKLLTGGTYMESTQVLLGKENWLFYKAENDGQPIYDYMGINRYEDSELELYAQEMTAVNEYVENEMGVRFVVTLIPNKEIVYEEYMPDTIARVEKESRGEQIAKYIQNNTDVTFIYPKDEIIKYKEDYQLYYNTDTHWNQIGAFVGLQAIFNAEYGTYASPDTVSFIEGKSNFAGDLARIGGVKKQYRIDQVYEFDPTTIDPKQYRDEVAIIVGDSFSGFLTTIAQGYYKEVYRFTIDEFTPQMLEEYDADILIWESVERYVRFPNRRRFGLAQ